jgi:hypothetical protein
MGLLALNMPAKSSAFAHHLKALKLPTFLREYDKLARQCAAEGLDHIRFLLRLAELELIDRERRMVERRIKEARFPAVKSLDSFDFAAIPSLNKTLVLELARSEYVTRRENIIAVGNSGTGKTHIGLGLGLAACQKGLSVGFYTAAALVHELLEARPTLLHCMSLLLALSGLANHAGECLLLGDEQTSEIVGATSAFDPQQKSVRLTRMQTLGRLKYRIAVCTLCRGGKNASIDWIMQFICEINREEG